MTENTFLSHFECQRFMTLYLDGILKTGLLEPLVEISKESGRVGVAAASWLSLQIQGHTPQGALRLMNPKFPDKLVTLLKIGFEKSILDQVIAGVVNVYQNNDSAHEVDGQLNVIIEKFIAVTTEFICAHCWQEELQKILRRLRGEGAKEVYLEQEGNEFFHQKYVAIKLVRITEPAISAVYETLQQKLESVASSSDSIDLGGDRIKVIKNSQSTFELTVLSDFVAEPVIGELDKVIIHFNKTLIAAQR